MGSSVFPLWAGLSCRMHDCAEIEAIVNPRTGNINILVVLSIASLVTVARVAPIDVSVVVQLVFVMPSPAVFSTVFPVV